MDKIEKFCNQVMVAFADAAAAAKPESPFAQARARLGDAYYEVVADSLKREVCRLLHSPEDALAQLRVTGQGGLVLTEILAPTFKAVIAAAASEAA
ncbi:MAG: hypothetical protein AMXMBFR56_65790 [Polyangiaceae bacterium]